MSDNEEIQERADRLLEEANSRLDDTWSWWEE